MKNSVAVRFTLDFANKAIVGSKASYDKAGKGSGEIYKELVSLMVKHPDFVCVVKEPKKPAKPKQTYKGMDIPFILDYLAAVKDAKTLKTVNDVIAFADAMKKHSYPLVKRVLFDAYEEFDYTSAKKIVNHYRHSQMLINAAKKAVEDAAAKATAEAAKKTASTESKQSDPEKNNIIPAQNLAPAGNF